MMPKVLFIFSVLAMQVVFFPRFAKAQKSTNLDVLIDQVFDQKLSNGDSLLEVIRQTLEGNKARLDSRTVIKCKLLAAQLFYHKRLYDTAKLLLLECDEYYRNNPGYYYLRENGILLYNVAMTKIATQDYENAEIVALEAARVFEKLKDPFGRSKALTLSGNADLLVGNYAKALESYLEAYRIRSTLPEHQYDPILLINIANLYSTIGQHKSALEFVNEGIDHIHSAKMQTPNLYLIKGKIFQSLKNFDSALYYYEKSKKASQELNLPCARAELNSAVILSEQSQLRRSNLILRGLIKRSELVLETGCILAGNYLLQRRYDSALYVGKSMLQLLGHSNLNSLIGIRLSEIIGSAFKETHQLDSALRYLSLASVLKDSLYNEDAQKKIGNLYAEMASISAQNRIRLLEQENELMVVKRELLVSIVTAVSIIAFLGFLALFLLYRNRQKKQQLINYQLKTELDLRRNELHQQALRIIYANNLLADVKESMGKLKAGGNTQDVQSIVNSIQVNKALEKEWDNFESYFGSVHTGFFEQLQLVFPGMTIQEKRLAGLVRMNLTNAEIASILNIEKTSVKMAKYRLKRRLGLSDETDLGDYLQNIQSVQSPTSEPTT